MWHRPPGPPIPRRFVSPLGTGASACSVRAAEGVRAVGAAETLCAGAPTHLVIPQAPELAFD